ncbi:MAG: sugar MFS transporter [Planctomycetaceae bacterium]|jgi:FHS family L-fucose permease-like MFS transporter|nr:sugar MFS transporter [Planctomycetaceae bacterium]
MKSRIIPQNILLPFVLLTSLFFAWAIPNNLTDTMLAAFKRIMSMSDSKTAWIQVVCYLFGYGFCAIPGALFIKKFTYKSGVLLGLSFYAGGCFLFYPAMWCLHIHADVSFIMYLTAIFILFAGLSVLETATNSYICAIGPEETATQRLNFSQSFNPFGAITGVVISQVFILSQLNLLTASERVSLPTAELAEIQKQELNYVTLTYSMLGFVMFLLLLAILFTKMPNLKEGGKKLEFVATFRRLMKNKNYVWGVVAQFFYVGAQISVWSFVIRYVIHELDLNGAVASLGTSPSPEMVVEKLRNVEPIAACFYRVCETIGLNDLLPRTSEQAGATYYIMSLILFVVMRFVCTGLMKFITPRKILSALAITAVVCCLLTVYGKGMVGVYALVCITGCMSLMFPTIYGFGVKGLGDDMKIGGAGMVMAIAGAAVLTQIQGIVSDSSNIKFAYWIPTIAFAIISYYSLVICKKIEL